MIWLTWRQFRGSAAIVLGALAVGVVARAITGPQLADLLRDSGEDFFTRLSTDGTKKAVYMAGTALAYAVPAVVGCSGARPWWRASSSPAPTDWFGTRASPAAGGSFPSWGWQPSAPCLPVVLAWCSPGGLARWTRPC